MTHITKIDEQNNPRQYLLIFYYTVHLNVYLESICEIVAAFKNDESTQWRSENKAVINIYLITFYPFSVTVMKLF